MAVQGGSQVLLPPTPAEIPPGAIFEMLKNKMNTGLSGHGQRMGRGHPLDNAEPLGDLPGVCRASHATSRRYLAPPLFDHRPHRVTRTSPALDLYSYYLYTYTHYMPRKALHSFYLDPDLTEGLKVASEAEYMPQSQIVRLAIWAWLRRREYLPNRSTRKGGTKKR